jgi:hypothetical protein
MPRAETVVVHIDTLLYLPPPPQDVLDKRMLIRRQLDAVTGGYAIECICGRHFAMTRMYRCLYCGVWFCATCAEVHFGQTRAEYREKHPDHWPDEPNIRVSGSDGAKRNPSTEDEVVGGLNQ